MTLLISAWLLIGLLALLLVASGCIIYWIMCGESWSGVISHTAILLIICMVTGVFCWAFNFLINHYK